MGRRKNLKDRSHPNGTPPMRAAMPSAMPSSTTWRRRRRRRRRGQSQEAAGHKPACWNVGYESRPEGPDPAPRRGPLNVYLLARQVRILAGQQEAPTAAERAPICRHFRSTVARGMQYLSSAGTDLALRCQRGGRPHRRGRSCGHARWVANSASASQGAQNRGVASRFASRFTRFTAAPAWFGRFRRPRAGHALLYLEI